MASDPKRFDVVGIGNAIVDVIARVGEDFVVGHGLVKGSMNLIDEARAEELYSGMGQAIEVSGGSAGNTAAGVASLGGRAAYFGKVKNDQLGAIFRHDMRAQGVAFDTPPAGDGPATARSFILVTPDSERTMNTYLGACVNFTTADVDRKVVEAAAVTYMEGYLWDRPEAKEAFKLAAKFARAAGRKTALTLSDSFCVERHRPDFLALVRDEVDILFANEHELCSLYETNSFDEAVVRLRRDCRLAAVTRSHLGSVVITPDEYVEVPPMRVDRVVDATGAGDMYAAGFLVGVARGASLADCGLLATIAATEVIGHVGPRPLVELSSLVPERLSR